MHVLHFHPAFDRDLHPSSKLMRSSLAASHNLVSLSFSTIEMLQTGGEERSGTCDLAPSAGDVG